MAPNYKKYDLHAVQVMGANIELWKYRLYKNDSLHLEEVFHKDEAISQSVTVSGKNPVMAGKKAAETRTTTTYSFFEHTENKLEQIQGLAHSIREFVISLDAAIEEVPKKFYVAYKVSQNILCMEVKTRQIRLFVKLNPSEIANPPTSFRDVSAIGHYGTGDAEFTISTQEQLEEVKVYIESAYNKVGS